ncbi:hypothetical protein HYQ44_018818 [Verticillium longisporum]|nr:hypothetical protein HYQ44_018818 [Verticillium longisporum]
MFQRAPTSNSNRRPQKVGRRKFPSLSSHPSTTTNNHRNNSLACNCVYLHCIRYGCCVVRSTVAGWASALTCDLEHCFSRFLHKCQILQIASLVMCCASMRVTRRLLTNDSPANMALLHDLIWQTGKP